MAENGLTTYLNDEINACNMRQILIASVYKKMIHPHNEWYIGNVLVDTISQDKARKGVIYPLKKGIYALVEISERTLTR